VESLSLTMMGSRRMQHTLPSKEKTESSLICKLQTL
jgi:hypothetical protein